MIETSEVGGGGSERGALRAVCAFSQDLPKNKFRDKTVVQRQVSGAVALRRQTKRQMVAKMRQQLGAERVPLSGSSP